MIRLAANLSLLFADVPFIDRFGEAARNGFEAVEFWWPPQEAIDEIPATVKDHGLEVALFNFYAGDMAAGDRGLLSDPQRHGEFRANVPVALELASQVACPRLNALVGTAIDGIDPVDQRELAIDNVRWAADQARARGVTIMVEAVNTFENGPYLLSTTDQALAFVDEVGRENVALQYDAYHMQRMEGNITAMLRTHLSRIGHIQIADSPDRGEPGTGELDYGFVLREVERLGYAGYVGLEYKPAGGPGATVEGLTWRDHTLGAGAFDGGGGGI
jgi:hydroxypyruvate isomerase